jgi:hypothetical protein
MDNGSFPQSETAIPTIERKAKRKHPKTKRHAYNTPKLRIFCQTCALLFGSGLLSLGKS